MAKTQFTPVNVCRGCKQPTPQCHCGRHRRCRSCSGRGFNCWDDICRGRGRCMHGDSCSACNGTGRVVPERVLVCPDEDAFRIRQYLRDHPELRKGEYSDDRTDEDPLLGLCYPAAEAFYHVRDCDLDVYCLSWSDVEGVDEEVDATHWYLREPEGDRRWIDLGLPLMPPVDLPPFEAGTRRGFITGDEPSKRAQQVLDGIEEVAQQPQ